MKKKIFVGMLASMFLVSGAVGLPLSQAAPQPDNQAQEAPAMTKAELDELAADVAKQYGVSQSEVRSSLSKGLFLDDVYYAAMLAKLSGKSYARRP